MAGPMPRKKMYRHLIEKLIANNYFDDWKASTEVCTQVNERVPVRCTQLNPSAVHRILREYELEERFIWNNGVKSMLREWKKI